MLCARSANMFGSAWNGCSSSSTRWNCEAVMAEEPRSNPSEYVTVEIYDQLYHLSGQDPVHIRELAAGVDAKMRAVAAHGRTADSLRVGVLAALNLADEVAQATSADLQLGHARATNLRMLLD